MTQRTLDEWTIFYISALDKRKGSRGKIYEGSAAPQRIWTLTRRSRERPWLWAGLQQIKYSFFASGRSWVQRSSLNPATDENKQIEGTELRSEVVSMLIIGVSSHSLSFLDPKMNSKHVSLCADVVFTIRLNRLWVV